MKNIYINILKATDNFGFEHSLVLTKEEKDVILSAMCEGAIIAFDVMTKKMKSNE
jgi:hypothetical protein